MSTTTRHYDMGRATYDLATNTRGYVYRDFTVDGDVPITVEHVCPDVMSPSKWRTNLDQTLTPNADGTKLTYTDGYGKTSVFERKFYYVVKGQKVYVTLADCETEDDSTPEKPHYKRDGYGNYSIKSALTGNVAYTVYERFEDGFGRDVKRDQELLDFLKKLENLDQLTEKKAVYYYADGLRKLEKDNNGFYSVELYKYMYNNMVSNDNIRSDSVIFGQFGDYPNRNLASGLLTNCQPTKFASNNSHYELKETALDERNTEKLKTKNVYFVKYPKSEIYEQIMRLNFDESFLQSFQSWLQMIEQYNALYEQKIYYEEAINTLRTSLSNERVYYNAITKRYRDAIQKYEEESPHTDDSTKAYYENKELLKAQYKPLYNLNNSYLQSLEKQKEIEKSFESISLRKKKAEESLKAYVELYKQLPLSVLTLADGTKLGFDYDGRMVSIQEGDKGVYLRYEEGLLRDVSDAEGVMATFEYAADGKWDTVVSRDGIRRRYRYNGSFLIGIEDEFNLIVTMQYATGLKSVTDQAGRVIAFENVADHAMSLKSPYQTIGSTDCTKNQQLETIKSLTKYSNTFVDEKNNRYKVLYLYDLMLTCSVTGESGKSDTQFFNYVNHYTKTNDTKYLSYHLDKNPFLISNAPGATEDQKAVRKDLTLNFDHDAVKELLTAAKGAAYNYDSEMRMTKAWQNGTMTEFSNFFGVQPGLAVSTDRYGRTSTAAFRYTPEGRLSHRDIDGVVTEYAYNRYGELTSERTYPLDNPMLVNLTEYDVPKREDTGEEILPYIAPLAGAVEPQDTKAVFSFEGDYSESTSITAEDEEHGVVSNFTAGYLTRAESANGSRVDFARDALGRAVGIALDGEAYANLQHVQQVGMSPYGYSQTVYYDKTTVSFANEAEEALEQVSFNGQVFETNYRNAGATVNLIKNTIDSEDRLLTHTDCVADEKTTYAYDTDDRVSARTVTSAGGGAIADGLASTAAVYTDGMLRSYTAKLKYKGEEETLSTNYQYTDTANPKLAEVTLPNARRVTYEYDGFGRPVEKRVWRTPRTQPPFCKNDPTHMISQRLSYRSAKGSTQNLIASERFAVGGREDDLTKYTYDESGRVTRIDSAGTGVVNYTYDEGGRLTREDNKALDRTMRYAYDGNGNIRRKTEYSYCLGDLDDDRNERKHEYYAYDTVHRDRLLSYNGEPCEYDRVGNPTKYRDKPLTWERCRLLSSYGGGAGQVTFRYDGQGMRRSKHVGPFTWKYVYDGARLMRTYCEMGTRLAEVLDFGYDGDGLSTILWKHKVGEEWEEHEYIVRRNILGDVTQLYDTLGNLCVQYRYDAWGQVYPITIFDYHGIARVNPILYRGYVYDKETELYYLNSRYYDPETGRFLNADSLEYLEPESVYGINLYAYCGGDPVNNVDPSGHSWKSFWSGVGNFFGKVGKVIGGALLAVIGASLALATLPISGIPGVGYLTQAGFSAMMYGGFAVGSVFDSEIQANMDAIGWNPFNSDTSMLTGESNGRKVSFYKGMPVVWTNHSNGRSFSFMGIWLTGNNDENDINHERGHGTQQGIMGALSYALMIGIPSWQEFGKNKWPIRDYYRRPWEASADMFGHVSTRTGYFNALTDTDKKRARWYMAISTIFPIFGYFFLI